jgi:pSer/pThr/pTyr-binding forkhead associated (FHA) protein
MAYLQIGDQQFLLRPGVQRVAPDEAADIPLAGAEPTATALVEVGSDQSVIIRKASAESAIKVNGIALGAEPAPLIHGDRIEIGSRAVRFGDTKQSGSTQFITNREVVEVLRARAGGPAKPTTATGGRLVSLVDGREYVVPAAGLVIGRDPSADVVVATAEVSRRHVRIEPAGSGYLLSDLSTNGVWVNGERVDKTQVLGRGDIVKVAAEEFRFYADVAKPAPGPAPAPADVATPPQVAAPAQPQTAAPVPPASVPPASVPFAPVAPASVAPPPPAAPLVRPSGARPALAVLEVLNEGPSKGVRFDVTSPVTNIGRGEHNDLVLASESVSDSHAKLQKRETGWVLEDLDSTNGSYVGGRRVQGQQPLSGAPDLRFGDIKVTFRSLVETTATDKGTRAITGVSLEQARRASERPAAPATAASARNAPNSPAPPTVVTEEHSLPIGLVLLLIAVVAFAGWWFFLRGS